MASQAVRIFTIVYGEAFIKRYVEVMLPSLLQPGNLPAMISRQDVSICLYTRPDSVDPLRIALTSAVRAMRWSTITVEQFLQRLTIHAFEVDDIVTAKYRKNPTLYRRAYNRRFQVWCLIKEIERCLEHDAVMIMGTADSFFSDCSIQALVDTSLAWNCSIGAPYFRVDRDRFAAALARETLPIDGARLASLSLESLHEAQRSTLVSPDSYTYLFGNSFFRQSDTLWVMRDFVPTISAARFKVADHAYFSFHGDFRHWDMTWPQKLIAERRFAYVGSSDIAVRAELTPASPTYLEKYQTLDAAFRHRIDPNDYLQNGLHSETMRNLAICIRTDRAVEWPSPSGPPDIPES